MVRNNYVHDNFGNGLWTDTDNVNTLYEGNTTTNNYLDGILHEVSYSATIRNNISKDNAAMATNGLSGQGASSRATRTVASARRVPAARCSKCTAS